jgi:hypothetical protein
LSATSACITISIHVASLPRGIGSEKTCRKRKPGNKLAAHLRIRSQCFIMFSLHLQNHYKRICSFFLSSLTITRCGLKTRLSYRNILMLLAIEGSEVYIFITGGTPHDFAIQLGARSRRKGCVCKY